MNPVVWLGEVPVWEFLVAKVGVKTALSILTLPRKFLNALSVWADPAEERLREVADRGEGREQPDGQDRVDLISAIDHPVRRRILRRLHDCRKPRSPSRLGRELDEHLGTAAYHVRVLESFGAVEQTGEQQVRGAIERFYASTIEDDPPIETLLEETREADEETG